MGGASIPPGHRRSAGFPLGDKAKGPYDEIAEMIVKGMNERMKREKANHSAHVEAFRKHLERINRPWTWRNYVAAGINWLCGNGQNEKG